MGPLPALRLVLLHHVEKVVQDVEGAFAFDTAHFAEPPRVYGTPVSSSAHGISASASMRTHSSYCSAVSTRLNWVWRARAS